MKLFTLIKIHVQLPCNVNHHGIIDSSKLEETYNAIQCKHSLSTASVTPKPLKQHQIQTLFKHLQGWCLNHLPGQPI